MRNRTGLAGLLRMLAFTLACGACGSSGAHSPGAEAGATDSAKDARGTPDVKSSSDAGRDAGHRADASAMPDASKDSLPPHDATAADADAAAYCTATSSARGTVAVLAQVGAGSINDFDVDCVGVVLALSDGSLSACPATGCTSVPATLVPAGALDASTNGPSYVRIAGGRLWFLDPVSALEAGGQSVRPIRLYSVDRDGGGETPVVTYVPVNEESQSVLGLFASSSTVAFPRMTNSFPAHGPGGVTLELVENSSPDASAVPTASGNGVYVAATRSAYYVATASYTLFHQQLLRVAQDAASTTFVDAAPLEVSSFAASDTVVVWGGRPTVLDSGMLAPDASAFAAYACAAGATCDVPVAVTGLAGWSLVGAFADAVFLAKMSPAGDVTIGACTSTALLAGSCTPAELTSTIPSPLDGGPAYIARFMADPSNVYVLLGGDSRVYRIAR
jgi:hypothetical protein